MHRRDYYANMSRFAYPFYILFHPAVGFQELKNNKKFSLLFANGILLLWVIYKILDWGYSDFDFMSEQALMNEVSIPQILLTTVLIFAIAVTSNWCFCTLMDGKGRAKEIWIACAYALIPYILLGILRVLLTHVMILDEASYLIYMRAIGLIWSALLEFIALKEIHEYSGPKTILSIVLTILGVLIIAFLVVLVSGIAQQIYSFFATVIYELRMRHV